MKRPHSALRRGFTLIELLVVITLIALLLVLGLLAIEFATTRSRQRDTTVFVQDIHRVLSEYNGDHGGYPRPADEEETTVVKNETYAVGGARMLYQVLSGDGTDAILNGEKASTGEQGSAQEENDALAGRIYLPTVQAPTRKMKEEKKQGAHVEAWAGETFYVVDAWRHPLQYHRSTGPQSGPGGTGDPRMHSENVFEIWSYGKLKKPQDSDEARKKWITNWGQE